MGSFFIRALPKGVLFLFSDGGKQMPRVPCQCFVFLLMPGGHKTVDAGKVL